MAAATSARSFTTTTNSKTSRISPITARSYTWCGGSSGWSNAPRDPATQEADRRSTRWGWRASPRREPGARGLVRNRRGAAGATPYLLQCEATGIYPTWHESRNNFDRFGAAVASWTGSDPMRWERERERRRQLRRLGSWLQNGAFMWRCQVYKYYWQTEVVQWWMAKAGFTSRFHMEGKVCAVTTFPHRSLFGQRSWGECLEWLVFVVCYDSQPGF